MIGSIDKRLVVLGLVMGAAQWLLSPARAVMVADSPLYIRFDPIVSAGYPAFVRLIGLGWLLPVQLLLLTGAAIVLAVTVQRVFDALAVSVLVLAAILGSPMVVDLSRSVLSEGLFLPIDILFLAALLAYVDRRRTWVALAAAALCGVGAITRPMTYPLVVSVIAAVWLCGSARRRHTLLLVAGCTLAWIAIVGGERVYAHWRHGDRLTSLTGLHLYAKSALLDVPPISTRGLNETERRLADDAEVRYAPVRALVARARGTVAGPAVLAYYEICLQRDCIQRRRAESGLPEARFNEAMLHVGRLRVAEDPAGYLRLAAAEFRSLWLVSTRTYPPNAARFDAFIASARPLPLEGEVNPALLARTVPSRAALLTRPMLLVAALLSAAMLIVFGWLLLVRRRRDRAMVVAWCCTLGMELVLGFTAFAGIGDGHYTMTMWPNIVVALALGALAVARGWLGRGREA